MTPAARALGLGLVLWLAGCLTPTAMLERPWLEVSSENFSIYTSLAEPEARELLEDLEFFRATVSLVSNIQRQTSPVLTEIVAFRSQRDFAPFRPESNIAGFFQPGLRANRVALASTRSIDTRAIMYHEYTHFLVRNQNRLLYPPWFDEGFSELLGSISVEDDWILVGTVPEHRRDTFAYVQQMPFSQLIRAADLSSWSPDRAAMFYAQSWLLVHYLMYGRPEEEGEFSPRMTRYLGLIEQRVAPDEAFPQAFGIGLLDLQRRIDKYSRAVPSYRFPRDRVQLDFATRVRPMRRDEVGVRLGWLALSVGQLDLAEDLFDQAKLANPSNSRASAGIGDVHKFSGRWDEAESAYREALHLEPDSWENHLDFGEYFFDRAVADEGDRLNQLMHARDHLRRSIELAPGIPEGYAVLGMTYVVGNDEPQEGIAALERAAALLPSHPAIPLPLAHLYLRTGDRERAIALLHRVVHWSHSPEAADEANRLLEELGDSSGRAGE